MPTRPRRELLVCHDCCCGTTTKHPDVDHDRQRDTLLAAAAPGTRVRVVDCLDACERSNVVVVRDLTAPRRQRDTWLGDVLDPAAVSAIGRWMADGGTMPDALHAHVMPRPRP